MAAPVNPLSSLAFTQPELQDISRQRKLSEMLLQQGMQGGKGQMVGNIYVPSHPLEGIADAYAIYKSGKLSKEANAKEQKLARQLRETQATEAQDILGALQGKPAVAEVIPDMQTLRDDQGNLTMGAQAGSPAVAGSQQAALAKALAGQSPFAQTMAAKLMEQQFKQPKWEKVERLDPKTGNTIAGMVDVNSAQPENTFRELGVSKPALSAKDIAELRDQGIAIPSGGGMSVGGVSMGGGQGSRVPTGAPSSVGATQVTGDAKYMPATLPTYEYNPSLSPKQNRELEGKFAEDLQKNVKNAKGTLDLLKQASGILGSGSPSSGLAENVITGAREIIGGGGEQSKADQRLKIIGGALTMTQPRFEGPQGVLDVKLYEKLAGDLGNANLPIATRLAAIDQMINMQKKYYPNGDWDSINTQAPEIKPNMFGGANTYFGATVKPRNQPSTSTPTLRYDPKTGEFK